jgi:YD repeat-containing protein
LGRLALVTDDDGAETAFGYDENGISETAL